ncbi:MAG: diphthine synthase [DPANN group archaeon]|nr:diphthine synthase [DPANN group archaeon]
MLYLIGLGLDWKDLSLKALEALHKCDDAYIESYTSLSNYTILQLEKLIGKKIKVLDRKKTEEEMPYLKFAHIKDTAVLIHGDPLSATTHFEILAEAKKKKIETTVIHAPSVFTAIAETGLSLYRFGKVASIPILEKNFQPESFFDILKENLSIGAHTLFLLDLRPDENRFLQIKDAIKVLTEINVKRNENVFTENTFVIACARLGTTTSLIKSGTAAEIAKINFGESPYCLIVPARLNHKEEEYAALHF